MKIIPSPAKPYSNPSVLSRHSPAVSSHHERLDGSGYPRGLKGDEIFDRSNRSGRDATTMTSDRVYRKAMSREDGRTTVCRTSL